MSKYWLTVNQTVCAAAEKMLPLMESSGTREGTAGINAERMGRTNAVSIHPTKLSFPSSAAGENMGELFSIQEKPTGKSLLIPKLFFISPAGDATSSTHRCPTASL